MPDHVKCAFQVRIQDCIEFFFRHPHDQIVPCDSGIIDKDVNSAVFLCYCLYKGFTLCKIRNIAFHSLRHATLASDVRRHRFRCFCRAVIINDHRGSFCCQCLCHCFSDAP